MIHETNAVAIAEGPQGRTVETRSNLITPRRLAVALAVLLVCSLASVGLRSKHLALVGGLEPQEASVTRELDEAIGATVEPLDPATAHGLGLTAGTNGLVVTSVASGGPAERSGIRTGDVVVAIDRPVASTDDLAAGLRKARKDGNVLTVTLKRQGRSVIVPLTVRPRAGQPSLAEEDWR